MQEEKINEFKDILKKFIYTIRTSLENKAGVYDLVFHYYNDTSYAGLDNSCKTYPVNSKGYYNSFNYEKTKQQIQRKILTNRNNYWGLNETISKELESFCISKSEEFDNLFKKYIEYLWKCDFSEQEEEFNKKEQEEKNKLLLSLSKILKDKYELYKEIIPLILEDKREYPYKSDKIKVLLELELDVETIFYILQLKEKWFSPKGYINKYFEERQKAIKDKKIVLYELNSSIKHITNQLKGN